MPIYELNFKFIDVHNYDTKINNYIFGMHMYFKFVSL